MNLSQNEYPLVVQSRDVDSAVPIQERIVTWKNIQKANEQGSEQLTPSSTERALVPLRAILSATIGDVAHLRSLTVIAADRYCTVLEGGHLSHIDNALVAFEKKSPTDDFATAQNIFFPKMEEHYSVRSPVRIIVTTDRLKNAGDPIRLHFLDASDAGSSLVQINGATRQIRLSVLLSLLGDKGGTFTVLADDRFERSFHSEALSDDVVLVETSHDTWDLCGRDFPRGMGVKKIFFISAGHRGIFLTNLNREREEIWRSKFLRTVFQSAHPTNFIRLTICTGSRIAQGTSIEITQSLDDDALYHEIVNTRKRFSALRRIDIFFE